jgi:glycosyltransferase involved in cell wall biosynthesis
LDHATSDGLAGWLSQPLSRWLVTEHAPDADAMITVAQGIATRYAADLGRPVGVVMNAPAYRALAFRPTDAERIRIVHHGAAMRARRLERLIDTVALCEERFSLELMLVPTDPGHIDQLRAYADTHAQGRVTFRDPVMPAEIVRTIHETDVGLALIPPRDFSYLHCLPNKLFDFIMAGLAVVTGPSPEMARIVRTFSCGVVAPTFEPADLAAEINALTPEAIDRMKQASLEAAGKLNAETEMNKLRALYRELLAAKPTQDSTQENTPGSAQ